MDETAIAFDLPHARAAATDGGRPLDRISVADSRTELDWALKRGRMAVWAPTHMATAALGRPVPDAGDPVGLARWLAGEIGARGFAVGGAAAVGGAVALRSPADIAALQEEDLP